MTLLKTALKNLKKNPVMNIICLMQLTAVFLITAVMVSTMSIRYRTYAPIKDLLESKGFYTVYDYGFFGAVKPGAISTQTRYSTSASCSNMKTRTEPRSFLKIR